MVLDSLVGCGLQWASAGGEPFRKHQQSDVVQQGGQLEMVQGVGIHVERPTDVERDRRSPSSVSGLPGQGAVDFLAGLTDEDAFHIAA